MAASLSPAEAEELEPAALVEDEADCMGLIFWLSSVLIQTGYVLQWTGWAGQSSGGWQE